MAEGTHVTVWFGKHDQDLLAMLKQPGVNASGIIKMALRAYVESSKPSVIADAVVDALLLRGLFFMSGEASQDDEVVDILSNAVQQFKGGNDGE